MKEVINELAEEVDSEMRRQLNEFGRNYGPTIVAGNDLYEQARVLAEKHGKKEAARMVVESALRPDVASAFNKALSGDIGGAVSILSKLMKKGDGE